MFPARLIRALGAMKQGFATADENVVEWVYARAGQRR